MESQFSAAVSLIADPVRSKILWTLLDGRAYTSGELATAVDVSQQNMSIHLNKLLKASILVVIRQGRHRYYQFAKEDFAYAIENLANLIPHERVSGNERITGIKYCRTCYDHLAGKVAVLITQRLTELSIIVEAPANSYLVTTSGEAWLNQLSIDVKSLKQKKRLFAVKCLDWSERKHHLAGALGGALLSTMIARDWIQRTKHSREMTITANGQKELHSLLNIIV